MTKQEKTALNMARFIRSQTLTLLEKLNELDADASGMTVKTSDICSSRRRSQLACERMPGADKPARARQGVLAGFGAQP